MPQSPRGRERFGFVDDGRLLLEVGVALVAQLREVALAAAADEIGGAAEAIPQPLRRLARRFSDFLPLRVQLAQRARRGGQVGRLARLFFGLERRDDGFGHRDELFLALRVGEAAPLVHLAQLAHARRDLLLQRAELARRRRRSRATTSAFGRMSRPVLMSRIRRSPSRSVMVSASDGAARALGEPASAGRARPAGPVPRRRVAPRRAPPRGRPAPPRRPRSRAARSSAGRDGLGEHGGEAACLAAERLPARRGRRVVVLRRQALGFGDERVELGARVSASRRPSSCRFRHAATALANRSASRSASGPLPTSGVSDRHSSSIGRSCSSDIVAVERLDAGAERVARRDGFGAQPRLFGRLVELAFAARDGCRLGGRGALSEPREERGVGRRRAPTTPR